MVKDVFHPIAAAAKRLFTNWAALLISLSMYSALLGAIYLFFNIREATATQVALNLILPVIAVALFLLIQAVGLNYVQTDASAAQLMKRLLGDCRRILLVSLPLILIAWLIVYLFGKVDQAYFSEPPTAGLKVEPEVTERVAVTVGSKEIEVGEVRAGSKSSGWGAVAVNAVRILLLYCLLPLIAIHLWIEAVSQGVAAAFLEFRRVLTRALAPRSLLIYVMICAVFSVTIYFLLFQQATFKGAWTQLWAVGIKTALALLLAFIGWLLTLGSLTELTERREMSEV